MAALLPFLQTPAGGGLIKGVTSLLGGLFGRSSAKKARAQALEDQQQQFVRLRDAAMAAGFNPLTVLRSAPSSGMVQPTEPVLASGQIMADALGAAADTYFNQKAMERDPERDALEKALMRAELQDMQRSAKSIIGRDFGFSIPEARNYTGYDDAAVPPLSGSVVPGDRSGFLRFRNLPLSEGLAWDVDGNLPTAEAVEREYGDVAQEFYGVGKLAWDIGNNIGRVIGNYWPQPRPKQRPKLQPINPHSNYWTVQHAGPLSAFR